MESAAVPPVSGDPGQAPGGQRAEVEGRERTVIWEGLPLGPSVTERWAEVQDFPARPDDILIATYPKAEVQDFTARPVDILIDTYTKAGTTWVVEMVDAVLSQGDLTHCFRAPSHNRAPFLELNAPLPFLCALDILKTLPSPRMIKTHLPIRLVPQSFWDNDCKVRNRDY
uniref:Sulfotransferase n=1 Tax=Lepisosteus oculatus TaxID=7918 RepID=W5LWN8_LEPOC